MRGAFAGIGSRVALTSCSLGAWLFGSVAVNASAPRDGPPGPHPALEDKIPELKAARQGARERLGDPQCQAVLADFESVDGEGLDRVLRANGRTAQEQLDLLVFESGLGRHVCERPVLASTQIHSSVVSICLRPFTILPQGEQQAVLIHEMLHSLGLGEGPPKSVAITTQVLKRCGH